VNKKPSKTMSVMISLLLLLNTACTTVKPVYDVGAESYASQLEPGDRVKLTYLHGLVREIDVTAVNEREIRGTVHKNTLREPKGLEIVADWRDIDTVETVKVSALKTTGAAVGILVAIPIFAAGVLVAGMASGS